MRLFACLVLLLFVNDAFTISPHNATTVLPMQYFDQVSNGWHDAKVHLPAAILLILEFQGTNWVLISGYNETVWPQPPEPYNVTYTVNLADSVDLYLVHSFNEGKSHLYVAQR